MKDTRSRCLFIWLSLGILVLGLLHSRAATYSNPVLPGDYPDPSVIREGSNYWATATTSEWAPIFPLLHSTDLVNWEVRGAVFQKRPAWSVGNYWAPEISKAGDTYFVYYVARRKDGPLSVAVATAKNAIGPYTDHGPLISQEAGSIDPVTVEDESGALYLIWKEDGNSRKLPTILWAQKLSADGTKLIGTMKELFRNDAAWEGAVVEGPFVVKRDGWFYMFYSGSGCCGDKCNYALGVARARALLGPWEKYSANPILAGNEKWKCPGHGSIVRDSTGRDFLLYHAYDAKAFTYVGRQGLLDEVKWSSDGWPAINNGKGPSSQGVVSIILNQPRATGFSDEFRSKNLDSRWQWPQSTEPVAEIDVSGKATLRLQTLPGAEEDPIGAVLAVQTTSGDYTATACLQELEGNATGGLAAFGDKQNALGISRRANEIVLWRRQKNKHEVLFRQPVNGAGPTYFQMRARTGHQFQFLVSSDGSHFSAVGAGQNIAGTYLPPWDRGVRVALLSGGAEKGVAVFDWIRVGESGKGEN